MNAKKMEEHQVEETPNIKLVKECAKKKAKRKAKKKLTLLEISKLIERANRKGPDSLTPEELEIVNEYAWVEELHGDANAMLQEMLFYLHEGPTEGVTPKDVLNKLSQKDKTEYRDARIALMKLIDNLRMVHDFGWDDKKPDRNVKGDFNMTRAAIAKVGLMTTPRILQAEIDGLKALRNLPKNVLDVLRQEMFESEAPDQDGSPSDTKMRKDDY